VTALDFPDLVTLADAVRRCTTCTELTATRTNVVVGDVNPDARLLLVGEAPGADEDLTGRPFVGRAGKLLDTLLTEAGTSRSDVSVLNVLKCRPPANRAPLRAEVESCRGWLEQQIRLLDPPVVVTLGGTAAAWAFGKSVRLADVRGRAHELPTLPGRRVVPTYHPSAALRFGPNGEPRRLLRDDLAFAMTLAGEDRA
jgi:uracil-DNA glycosylase